MVSGRGTYQRESQLMGIPMHAQSACGSERYDFESSISPPHPPKMKSLQVPTALSKQNLLSLALQEPLFTESVHRDFLGFDWAAGKKMQLETYVSIHNKNCIVRQFVSSKQSVILGLAPLSIKSFIEVLHQIDIYIRTRSWKGLGSGNNPSYKDVPPPRHSRELPFPGLGLKLPTIGFCCFLKLIISHVYRPIS